jgi:hypothetical protein
LSLLLAIPIIVPVVVAAVATAGTIGAIVAIRRAGKKRLAASRRPPQLPPATKDDEEVPETDVAELVATYTGSYDDSAFHVAESGDSISRLAVRILNKISPGAGDSPAQVRAVKQLLNSSEWNRLLYGEPMPDDIDAVDGVAINRVFLPKHENAIGTMSAGFEPLRNIDEAGTRIGTATEWGSPWAIALSHEAVEAGVTDPGILMAPPWPDGTPSTEPPPALLSLLRERP